MLSRKIKIDKFFTKPTQKSNIETFFSNKKQSFTHFSHRFAVIVNLNEHYIVTYFEIKDSIESGTAFDN